VFTNFSAWGGFFQYPLAVLFFFYQYSVHFFFFLVALSLALIILFLQGKGDLGVVGAWQGSQAVFGGSGGQDVVGKSVWVLGFIFMALCLYLSKSEVKHRFTSILAQYAVAPSASSKNPLIIPEATADTLEGPAESSDTPKSDDE
jgi:protein translocase SecG subunit